MTQEVGDALASYISQARHPSDTDALFIRSRAPMRPFQNQNAVSAIVGRAMRRAGVSSPSRGAAHVLRHSAATSMLRHGASLLKVANTYWYLQTTPQLMKTIADSTQEFFSGGRP
jgi:site-specific recombinase XerD